MNRSTWIILALVTLLVIGAFVLLKGGDPGSGLVDAAEFARLQADGVRVIDVRTAAEYQAGHIPGAVNVPLSSFADTADTWDPAEPIALYCATGSRSAEAAQMLASRGFETVYDLSGGMVAWDGEVNTGTAAAPSSPSVDPAGVAIMYEFYTDW